MRIRHVSLVSVVVFLTACEVDTVSRPMGDLSALDLKPAFYHVMEGCPAGHVCGEPTSNEPIYPSLDAVAANCPEACAGPGGPMEAGWPTGYYQADANGWYDVIGIACPTRPDTLWSSSHSCWDCQGNCAGNCPTGKDCLTVPFSPGHDCRQLECLAGFDAYVAVMYDGTKKAMCRKPREYAWEGPPYLSPPHGQPPHEEEPY